MKVARVVDARTGEVLPGSVSTSLWEAFLGDGTPVWATIDTTGCWSVPGNYRFVTLQIEKFNELPIEILHEV